MKDQRHGTSSVNRTTQTLYISVSRRRFLTAVAGLSCTGLLALGGCSKGEPPIRVASNVWPGYELMYVAEREGFFTSDVARMVAMPSATACLQALAAGNVEAAGLTLDEVLTARAENIPLVVVAVFDISMGADVMLARPEVEGISDLRGRRIGVEQSAVGAVMLDAILSAGKLRSDEVELVYATVDEHADMYRRGVVDALITFEPVPALLDDEPVRRLFDSSMIPGRIIDVLAVRSDVIEQSPLALQRLVDSHFRALKLFQQQPERVKEQLAGRLGVDEESVLAAFDGLELPDIKANHQWLSGEQPMLLESAKTLQEIMLKARLISRAADLEGLLDGRFLPTQR